MGGSQINGSKIKKVAQSLTPRDDIDGQKEESRNLKKTMYGYFKRTLTRRHGYG